MLQMTPSQQIDEALIKINACHFQCEAGDLHLNVDWLALLEGISAIEAHVARLQAEANNLKMQIDLEREALLKAYEWAAAHKLGIGFTVPDIRVAVVVYDACRAALFGTAKSGSGDGER